MTKTIDLLQRLYNTLSTIPVQGEYSTSAMSNSLKSINQHISELSTAATTTTMQTTPTNITDKEITPQKGWC